VICDVCHTVNIVADAGVHLELVPILGNSHFHADDHDICIGLMTMTLVVGLYHSDQLASAEFLDAGSLPIAKAQVQKAHKKRKQRKLRHRPIWGLFGLNSCSLI